MKALKNKVFFQFEIIIDVLVSSFHLIWIPIYGSTLSIREPNLRFWLLTTSPHWKSYDKVQPFHSAKPSYDHFHSVLLAGYCTDIGHEMCVKTIMGRHKSSQMMFLKMLNMNTVRIGRWVVDYPIRFLSLLFVFCFMKYQLEIFKYKYISNFVSEKE